MVKVNVNNKAPKKWYKSRTLLVNALLIISGITSYVAGEVSTGTAITVAGMLNVVLRYITKQELKI